jgi:transcriptional regulator with XRE-family HTH domain
MYSTAIQQSKLLIEKCKKKLNPYTPLMENLEAAKRFKRFRVHKDLTQKAMGQILGVTRGRISQIEENGLMSADMYRKLKQVYKNINLNWLMVGEGEMFVDQKAESGLVVQEPTVAYGEPVGTGTDVPEKELLGLLVQVVGDMQAKLAAHEGRLAALERALEAGGHQTT